MQDRLTYANGNTITTEGFRCSGGEPIDIKVTVGEDEEVELSAAAGKSIPNGDHLITLEVNGEKVAYRDLYHLGEDTVTVGDYTISDDLFLTGVSEDDEVVMRLESVELTVTDEFRAAVTKVAPKSEGGSGGGVLVVTDTDGTLDKTWQEIHDAPAAIIKLTSTEPSSTWGVVISATIGKGYDVNVLTGVNGQSTFTAQSADGYPSMG